MKAKCFILFFLIALTAFANKNLERFDYNWDENPVLTSVSKTDTLISACFLKNFISREIIYEDKEMYEYVLEHKKIKVLTHKGIEQFNKIYLPFSENKQMFKVKIRSINSKGQVFELKESNIKEGTDEDTGEKYKYFAIEGLDINSEVEYFYLYRRSPIYTGTIIELQNTLPQKDFLFEIICPSNLIFSFKSYNNAGKIIPDTSSILKGKEKNRWYVAVDSIPFLENQKSSAYHSQLQYIGYKLMKNLSNGMSDAFSYGEISRRVNEIIFSDISKSDKKTLNKIAGKLNIKKYDEEAKIRAIENFVKSNLTIGDYTFANSFSLKDAWDQKISDYRNATIIIANLCKMNNIEVEIGLTCNRFNRKFDDEFELWAYTNDFVFYFPSIDMFTTPKNNDRLGLPDYDYIGNKGLFVKSVQMDDQSFGVSSIRQISFPDYTLSSDTLRVFADIKEQGFYEVSYDIKHSFSGYKAQLFQTIIENVTDEDNRKELIDLGLNYIDDDGDIVISETKNLSSDKYGIQPAVINGKLTSRKFFERAGNTYIFKIGELIGPQMEMYDKSPRVLPVEELYNRNYYREIVFTIPDGYRVINIDDVNMNVSYKDADGLEIMAFVSGYVKSDNEVKVTIKEYYKKCFFPVELFPKYQSVVNAAADFNKVKIIFEKLN